MRKQIQYIGTQEEIIQQRITNSICSSFTSRTSQFRVLYEFFTNINIKTRQQQDKRKNNKKNMSSAFEFERRSTFART